MREKNYLGKRNFSQKLMFFGKINFCSNQIEEVVLAVNRNYIEIDVNAHIVWWFNLKSHCDFTKGL